MKKGTGDPRERRTTATGVDPAKAREISPRRARASGTVGPKPALVPVTLGNAEIHQLRRNQIEALREEVERKSAELLPRWNANPEDVQKSVAQLVLALVEFLRKLLERQAIRRMEGQSLEPKEVERIGLALMRLETTVHDLAARFGLEPDELNIDLGPLGRLS